MLYDFIIIGSGPAGSVITSKLAKKGFKIALVDRATNINKKSKKNSFIYAPYIQKTPFNYTPIFSNQLGGNSALWNNKIYLLTKDEFKTEQWNFNYEELRKNSLELSKYLKIKHGLISQISKNNTFNFSKSLRANKLGNLFEYLKIDSLKNVDVYTHSSPVKLFFGKQNSVKKIIIKDLKKDKLIELTISKSVIFCAGGLGNPNIINNLFKKNNKNIGKFLCDHPHINLGNFKINQIKKSIIFGKYFLNNSRSSEKNLYLKYKKNFVGIQLDFLGDPAKIIIKLYCQINKFLPKFLLMMLIRTYSLSIKFLNKILSLVNLQGKFSYEFFFSQKKSKYNQVFINKQCKDKFGNYKSDINWKISKDEKNIYNYFISNLIGPNGKLVKTNVEYIFSDKLFAGIHPSCTTQISKNKSNGCVNKDLKLHNYNNVFVCGSSVFKLNGFTNPTWTIMVLANRLARKLCKKYKN